jgi:hypothetical protein
MLRHRAAAPFGCTESGPPEYRTVLPCDPIFFHHTAILWTRLHGVSAAGRPESNVTIG